MKAKIPLVDNVHYELRDKDGNRKLFYSHNKLGRFFFKHLGLDLRGRLFGGLGYSMDISNLVTNAGFALVSARLISDSTEAKIGYIGVGTGTTAASATDTTLGTEITDSGLARAAATASQVTTDTTNDTAKFIKVFTVTGTKSITESAIFNASSGGTMVARQVFTAVGVSSGDTFSADWRLDID